MQAARATEGEQREVSRIEAALYADYADGALHIGVGNADDRGGRGDDVESQLLADTFDGGVGAGGVDAEFAAGELIRGDAAEDDVGVGYGGVFAGAVAGRAGDCSRAFGTDAE